MRPLRGMSFIDVIVGTALALIVFLAMFGLIRASAMLASVGKAKAGAAAVASSQMEYIRSLDYTQVGTVGGIPSGIIAQNSTTTMNGITYSVRTFIQYEDDAADGLAAADTNGITTDYKDIKVTVSYSVGQTLRTGTLVSAMAPVSIETTTGGGTLAVNVVNASGAAVSGATVRIVNASTSPTVDETTYSDSNGQVYLPGAATSTQYQVYVSRTGYSSAQTYARDATNQNPNPGYLTIVANQTTTGTFAIDALATLIVRTFSPITPALFTDLFNDATKIATLSSAAVSGGTLVLSGSPGTYPTSGNAISQTIAPTALASWASASSSVSVPVGTSVRFQVLDSSGVLLSDTLVPGNSSGNTSPVNLSSLSTTTYPSLKLKALLTSTDVNQTPAVLDWRLGYSAGPTALPNVAFTLTGAKTKGTTGGGSPIYKTTVSSTTDATGVRSLSLEWDLYTLGIGSYTIDDANPDPPFTLLPGTTLDATLIIH